MLALGSCTIGLVTACSVNKNTNSNRGKINLNPKAYDKTIPAEQLAEELALAGEQLMDPIRFMYADLVFNRALNIDPNNKRAKFYKGFISSFMQLRGIMKRVEPLVLIHGDKKEVKSYKNIVAKFPVSGMKSFLLDDSGKAKISNESEFQDFLDEYRSGQNDFRTFLKANKDLGLTLNINVLFAGTTLGEASQNCSVELNSENIIEYDKKCDLLNSLTIKLDRADMEALQHAQAGIQILTSLYTAYDLQGYGKFISQHKGLEPTAKDMVGYLQSQEKAGKLRTNNGLADIVDMGSDLVAATRWVLKNQKTLCPSGQETQKNRKRNMIKNDICLSKQTDDNQSVTDVLAKITRVLNGEVISMDIKTYGKNGSSENVIGTVVRPAALLLDPVYDLLKLAPNKFNECGEGTSLKDKTFGGMFPNKDADKFIIGSSSNNDCYESE